MRRTQRRLHIDSHNVDVNLTPQAVRLPPLGRPSLPESSPTSLQRKAANPERRSYVVKYVRRDRQANPTFCNSLAYPLPCYRYV